jgi:predicted nucleotide-binding protein (sugar kinase/HSP70/actin superfamily)
VDSGVGTRIAAFLDIIGSVRPAAVSPPSPVSMPDTRPVATRGLKPWHVVTLRGECVSLRDPRVTLAYPSMGTEYAQAMAAVSRRFGVRALALPPAGERTLAAGRELTSGRECLPATLTVGALTEYLQTRFRAERSDEILVYFMPTVHDPCRFSQYNVFIRRTLRRAGALDTALWSPSAEDGYRALGFPFLRAAWQAVTVAALMREIRPVLKTVARDRDAALRLLDAEWSALVEAFSRGTRATWAALRRCGERLQSIERQAPVACVPKVLLVGEIFARFDDLCGRGIEDLYASRGIAVIPPPVLEWLYYTEWCALNRVADGGGYRAPSMAAQGARRPARPGGFSALRGRLRLAGEARMERRARRLLAPSGLLATRQEDIDAVVRRGARYLHPALTGEAILTVGSAVDVLDFPGRENWLGLILIGPFNCMPAGVAESLLKPLARRRGVPWLTLECDGTPWPSNTLRQIEVHIRRVKDYAGE